MEKLKKVSRLFKILFFLNMLFMPIATSIIWLSGFSNKIPLLKFSYTIDNQQVLPISLLPWDIRLYAYGLDMLTVLVSMLLMWYLVKLFHLFENGEVFSKNTVQLIPKIGYTFLSAKIMTILSSAAISYVLTLHQKSHAILLTIADEDVKSIVIAFVIILVSWVMREAYLMREEQELTI